MELWQNRVAVVTGASSGIGQAVAKDLVAAGFQVVALGRREERLNANRSLLPEEHQKRFYPMKCDVSVESEVKATFEWIETTLGGIDVLINNAGIIRRGNLVHMDTTIMDEVLRTNVLGVIYCTQAAFKSMSARNFDGHVVHINSVAGHGIIQPYANESLNIYSPTKFALTAINETIRIELRNLGTKIKTTSISPGGVRTEIVPPEIFEIHPNVLNAEDVSQAVLFAISTPPHVQIHEVILRAIGETV